jgi:TPR repeat protein
MGETSRAFDDAKELGLEDALKNIQISYLIDGSIRIELSEEAKSSPEKMDKNIAEAQYQLGKCYELGSGVVRDHANAVRWYSIAAEQGHVEAKFSLGRCYFYSIGADKDLVKALELFAEAAEQGHAQAQFELGICYIKGIGLKKDKKIAKMLFGLAAKQGNESAKQVLEKYFS